MGGNEVPPRGAAHANTGARAIVVGGNIGGLTAAMALQRAGFDPVVLERRRDLHAAQAGGGILLWHGAMRALQELGLAERVEAVGVVCDRVENRTRHGQLLPGEPEREDPAS